MESYILFLELLEVLGIHGRQVSVYFGLVILGLYKGEALVLPDPLPSVQRAQILNEVTHHNVNCYSYYV